MEILFLSDTHGLHHKLNIPHTDAIIHAGDLSKKGQQQDVGDFLEWYAALPQKTKILVGGNHDFLLERNPGIFRDMLPPNITYLENSGTKIGDIQLWGSPITPWFHDWAFNRQRGPEINKYWEAIPESTDILITHGPPNGILDKTKSGLNVGCEGLMERVRDIKPAYHVFGHIHEASGIVKEDETTFLNVSLVNLFNILKNPGVLLNWEAKTVSHIKLH